LIFHFFVVLPKVFSIGEMDTEEWFNLVYYTYQRESKRIFRPFSFLTMPITCNMNTRKIYSRFTIYLYYIYYLSSLYFLSTTFQDFVLSFFLSIHLIRIMSYAYQIGSNSIIMRYILHIPSVFFYSANISR
jgi:hypothetical protein